MPKGPSPGSFPARLHVLLASQAPLAVVLRRGPARAVCTLLWDRAKDTFKLGQWFRGRIYERRSDLSPDGRYLIYFALKGSGSSSTGGSWTAVSRAPWLKAIVLLGKGNAWHGGGLFTAPGRYWVNGGCGHSVLEDRCEVSRDERYQPPGAYGGECPSAYYPRLQRDGWMLIDRPRDSHFTGVSIFEKRLPHGWILRKYAFEQLPTEAGHGAYWDEHELEQSRGERRLSLPKWEWAELDGKTVVWAERGCLYRASIGEENLGEARLLHDFNGMKFEARQAPY